MNGFTKLDSGIVDSSIWSEDSDTRVVWITLLAKADKNGIVNIAPSALARVANVPLPVCLKALERFQQPDSESRTPTNEGRRLAKTDDGWLILNYAAYREKEYNQQRREQSRQLMAKKRNLLTSANNLLTSANSYVYVYDKEDIEEEGGVGETAYVKQPVIPLNPTSPEPVVSKAEISEGGKWATELIKAFGETPAQAGASVWNETLANCCELVAVGKERSKFELLCDWIANSRNRYKPRSPQNASDPSKWMKWQTAMQDELDEIKANKARNR